MALFKGKSAEEPSISLTEQEAFAAVPIIAMNIDGINHQMEFKIIGMVLDRMNLFKQFDADSLRQMLQKLQNIILEKGIEPLYHAAVANLPSDLIQTAYAVAIDVVMADDKIVEKERALLLELADSLKIEPDMTKKIIDVMQIRYKG